MSPNAPRPVRYLQPDTRERLLRAAEHLFGTRGFRGTTVREIARTAGCNVSLVGYYFGSKEGLLREVLRPRIQRLRKVIEEARKAERITEAHLLAFLRSLATEVEEQRPLFRLLLSESLREDSPLGPETMEPIWENQRAVRGLFRRAVEEGLVRRDLEIPLLLTAIFGAIVLPVMVPRLLQGVLEDRRERPMAGSAVQGVAEIVFRGILARRGEEGP